MITSERGRGTAAAVAIGAAIGLWSTDPILTIRTLTSG
jgi:hypothetical protein